MSNWDSAIGSSTMPQFVEPATQRVPRRPCPLSSGHIQAGRHLGTNAEVAAWKGGSTEPLTWRTLSFGRSTRCSAVKWPALQLELGHYRETCLHRHLPPIEVRQAAWHDRAPDSGFCHPG